MSPEQRARAFLELSRFTGRDVSADFIRRTSEHFPAAGITRIHNLAEGIYKPAGDKYAFSIWSRSAAGRDLEIYRDVFSPNSDGTWSMEYAAKKGDLTSAINLSLFACMQDHVPILVVVTSRPSGTKGGAKYQILGPAIIENFDTSSRRFGLKGCSSLIVTQFSRQTNPLDAMKLQLRSQIIMPFNLKEQRSKYKSIRDQRAQAFRSIILEEYRCQCAVCQSKFLLRAEGKNLLVEAEAAHIISVQNQGPDDPRNGLSLCRRHHWAFDEGLFTITDARTIKISPAVLRAERKRFDLVEYEGEGIIPPVNAACQPSEKALHFHQQRKFRRI